MPGPGIDAMRRGAYDFVTKPFSPAELAVLRAETEAQRARIASAADQVDKCVVRSPFRGLVLERRGQVGELADDAANAYLAAGAQIRELFGSLPLETVMLSTALRFGPGDGFTNRLRSGWLSGSGVTGETMHAPVHIDDVARAVAVADRQRHSLHELHARLALVGPERVTLDEFLRRLGAPPLHAPRPQDVEPPEDWLVEWLSLPACDDTIGGTMTLAHGVNRLSGV